MLSTTKSYMLKLVPKLKTNKSLKLLLPDIKPNTSIYTYMIGNGMVDTKQAKMPYFQCGPTSQSRKSNWLINQLLRKRLIYMK